MAAGVRYDLARLVFLSYGWLPSKLFDDFKLADVRANALTGLSTFLVGCVPTYEQIGIWGAVLMVVLRFILVSLPDAG